MNAKPGSVEEALRRLRMDLTNAQTRVTEILNGLTAEQLARTEKRANAAAYEHFTQRTIERAAPNAIIHELWPLRHQNLARAAIRVAIRTARNAA